MSVGVVAFVFAFVGSSRAWRGRTARRIVMAHPGRMLSALGLALLALGGSACARATGDDTGATSQTLPSSHPIAGVDDEPTATDHPTEAPSGASALPVSAALDVSTLDDAGLAGVVHSFHHGIAQQAQLAERSSRSTELAQAAHEMRLLHSDTMTTDDALFLRLGIVRRASPVSRRVDAESERTLRALRATHGAAFDHAYLQDQRRTLQESLQVFAQAASVARSPHLTDELLRDRDDVEENLRAISREQRSSGIGVTNLQPPSVGGARGRR
jgi:predicted outer membrane protein